MFLFRKRDGWEGEDWPRGSGGETMPLRFQLSHNTDDGGPSPFEGVKHNLTRRMSMARALTQDFSK